MDARHASKRPNRHCPIRAVLLILFCGLLIGSIQAQSVPVQQEKLRDFDAVTLQLPYTHQFQFAGYYAAIEKGFYAQEGLVVNLREVIRGETPIDAVSSGRAQFGVAGSELVVERLRGRPVVALAAIFQHSPYVIISDARKNIRHPLDLMGKRVMMELSQRDAEFMAVFRKAGVDMNRIRIKGNSWNIDDLIEGRVDAMCAYITDKPFAMKKRGVAVSILKPDQYGIDFYGDCLFTSENERQLNPERVEAFLRASMRGWRYAMEQPDEVIAMIRDKYQGQAYGLTEEDLRFEADEMRKLIMPDLIPIGQMHPERWQHIAETYVELKLASKPYTLNGFLFWPKESEPDQRWLYWLRVALFATVLVALVVILWNLQLRRQVEKRTLQLKRQNEAIQHEAETLRQTEERLKASEAKFRRIYDANIMGMFYASATGHIQEANDAFLRLLGFTREDLDNGLVESMVFSDPEWHPLQPFAMNEIADRGVCTPYEKDLLCRNGTRVPTIVTAAVVGPEDKSVIAIVQDISEKRRLIEEQMKTSKLEAVGVLAGGIAHDFNNLLTPILGNLSLARNTSDNTPGMDGFLQLAEKACWRARDLTQQLLTFARGGAPVKKAAVLPDLIRDSTLFALHGSNVRAQFEIDDHLATVEADQGQLSQVLQNLVINAVHAMPQGGIIRLRAFNVDKIEHWQIPSVMGKHVCIEVADSGTGISPENLKRIFDPYFTTKAHGHGLGLATSFSIIRRHDGHIGVTSQLGKGSTFSIFLPVSRNTTAKEAAEPVVMKSTGKGGRVLIMDDEADIRQLVSDILSHSGFEVEASANGAETVRLYREAKESGKPFGVVILDLTVPGGMGGAETLQTLRKYDPAVKAIVCSGYSNDPIMAEYAKHHFKAAVRKPFSFDEITATVSKVMQLA